MNAYLSSEFLRALVMRAIVLTNGAITSDGWLPSRAETSRDIFDFFALTGAASSLAKLADTRRLKAPVSAKSMPPAPALGRAMPNIAATSPIVTPTATKC